MLSSNKDPHDSLHTFSSPPSLYVFLSFSSPLQITSLLHSLSLYLSVTLHQLPAQSLSVGFLFVLWFFIIFIVTGAAVSLALIHS